MRITIKISIFCSENTGQLVTYYLKGKGLNCCVKKCCEIFKGEKINLLLSHLKTHVIITYLKQSSFFLHLMVSPGLESE